MTYEMWFVVILAVALALFPLFSFLNYLSRKRNKMSAEEVAQIIEAHINQTDGGQDWGDFKSLPISDPRLDGIRDRCVKLDTEPWDYRVRELKKIVAGLRKGSPPAGQ